MSERRDKWQGMNWIWIVTRIAIYIRDNFTCQHCGLDMHDIKPGDGIRIELDHIIPVSHEGTNAATNLITSCNKCNLARGNKPIEAIHSTIVCERIRAQAQLPLNRHLAKQVLADRKANG